jgi:hypothetical protein
MAKGEQVVRDEALAEHFLAMAEILLEVRATVLKHVEVSFSIFPVRADAGSEWQI